MAQIRLILKVKRAESGCSVDSVPYTAEYYFYCAQD